MDSIIKDGVVNITHHVGYQDSGVNTLKEEFLKFRISNADTISKGSMLYETPNLAIKAASLYFNPKKNNLEPNAADTDLYRRGNLINDRRDIFRDRRVSMYIKQREDYNKVANDFRLDNKGFYQDNEASMGSLGNFKGDKICPIRKIDTDNSGTKFLSSISGFKNAERREMARETVPLKRIINSSHIPISSINNGTKSTRLIPH